MRKIYKNFVSIILLVSLFIVTGVNNAKIVKAVTTDAKLSGTLFKGGDVNEIRIKTATDFRLLRGKTLRLLVKNKEVEFGKKNVTRAIYKGRNNSTIFDAISEVLAASTEAAEEGVYEEVVDLNNGDTAYKRLIKSLNSGSLEDNVELLEMQIYDESYDAKAKNKVIVRFVVGGGVYTRGNLAAASDEEKEFLREQSMTEEQKKMNSTIAFIIEDMEKAKNINISLKKIGTLISSDVMNAIQSINSNSVVSFRFRSSKSKKLLYEWQASAENILAPRQINMKLSFSDEKIAKMMKKHKINKYKTILMQEHNFLGGKFKIGAKLNLTNFNKQNLKLYSVNTETGKIELKSQNLAFENGMVYFKTAYGENYILTDIDI